ncbi:exportin-6 [Teleopsis dalmanni]|uniref:exportin-6 n=1 Tax=Teleopsis dalmanni TaxID=139649 RepID=UPI0018CE349A|nr:exportin-6 [Teleopsis dalmanni]
MSSSLQLVQTLLDEFYQHSTSNVRRREIESQLINFKCQPEAWQLCLHVATSIESNQFLWVFCTSTLEHTVTRRWNQLHTSDRTLLRETLWNTYINFSLSCPRRQRETFAQLIALMGKHEFPDEHPNYIMNCIELIKTKFPLGISLLRSTSEEVMNNRENISTDRKNYFHSCISLCIPDVVDLLTKYLIIAVCHVNEKNIHSIPNNILDYTLITSLPNDNQLSSSILELLTCVQHLVSWISTDLISEYLLMSILDLSQWRVHHQSVSLAGLAVLNELLYLQKSLPHTKTLMTGINGLLEQHNTTKLQSEMYIDKFRELLRLYTIKYWPKMIEDNDILEPFLKSLYCCTISRNGALDFTEKLEIWTPIIKGLVLNKKLCRYNDIMNSLIGEILCRIQFEYNKAELELLDNENLEDNVQTEWQQYSTSAIETIALIGESRPCECFVLAFTHWSRPYGFLLSIENDIDSGKTVDLTRKIKCQSFSESLRDFSTMCQAVVRITPLLGSADMNSEMNNNLQLLTKNLLTILKFLSSNKLSNLNVDRSTFQTDLDYLYAQVLMAIRSILTVSNLLRTGDILNNLFGTIGGIFLPSNSLLSPIIYMAASQLLLCLTTVIRPKTLLEIPTIINIMQAGSKLTHLPRQVIANIYISLISYLVLPWKEVNDQQQDFPRRCALLQEYVQCLAQYFLELEINTESKISSITLSSLSIFSIVIEYFQDCNNISKDMLATAFKPLITKALIIYNNFGTTCNAVAISVAEFSLSTLRTLQTQLGTQFIKDMITLFIGVSSREHSNISRLVVVEKILQMFQLIVEQHGNGSMSMMPSILDFTIEHILPLIQHENNVTDNSDISSTVYNLFNSILTHKWQYFYKSHAYNNANTLQMNTGNLHPEHFLAILNAYGQILLTGNDPNVVRIILESLHSVNERWRLYQKALFRDNLLTSFQTALIKVLLSAEGPLHFDLLATSLFNMGQVDTLKLRDSFANAGLPINSKIIDEICLSTDIPTFSQKLSQLIQDAHCVHLTQT